MQHCGCFSNARTLANKVHVRKRSKLAGRKVFSTGKYFISKEEIVAAPIHLDVKITELNAHAYFTTPGTIKIINGKLKAYFEKQTSSTRADNCSSGEYDKSPYIRAVLKLSFPTFMPFSFLEK